MDIRQARGFLDLLEAIAPDVDVRVVVSDMYPQFEREREQREDRRRIAEETVLIVDWVKEGF